MGTFRRSAFTLIELLVVVAIIAVLAAMLLGVIGMVRESAKGIDCMSKLRQLGLASENYCNDNDGFIYQAQISYSPGGTNGDTDPMWGLWPGRVMPYLVTSFRGSTAATDFNAESWNRFFNCPSGNWSAGEIKNLAALGTLGTHGLSDLWTSSYGMNENWQNKGVPSTSTVTANGTYIVSRPAAAKQASMSILLGEKWGVKEGTTPPLPDDRAGVSYPTASGGRMAVPATWPRQTTPPSGTTGANIRQSHRGRMTLLFLDMHAGRHRLEETWNGSNALTSGWWVGLP